MGYSKIHEETLEIARQLIEKDSSLKDWVVSRFPELAESEDEKMRKIAIRACKYMVDNFENSTKDYEDALAWLEKQKPTISDDALREGIAHFGITQYQIDNWLKKYVDIEEKGEQEPTKPTDFRTWKYIIDAVLTEREGIGQYIDSPWTTEVAEKLQKRFGNIEQKSAWSEEDEKMFYDIVTRLHSHPDVDKTEYDKSYHWLKSIKDRVQPKQEWSEKDEAKRKFIEDELSGIIADERDIESPLTKRVNDLYSAFYWLKSLSPQPKQEWSDGDERIRKEILNVIKSLPLSQERTVMLCWLEKYKYNNENKNRL